MGIVTVTERQVYKRCRQRWDYTSHNRQNLEPILTPTALSLGRMVHEAHEKWILDSHADPVDLVTRSALEELDLIKKRYHEAVGAGISDDELGPFYETVELARTMMGNYRDFHGSPLPTNFELVGVEQRAIVPIPGSEHFLEATFDGIIRGPDGRVFVLERKTYRARPKIEALNTNDQFLAYSWALGKLELGPVGGVAYDGMWKRGISENQNRKNAIQLKDLFFRTLLIRPQFEIDRFEKYHALEANEMINNPPIYLNRRWEGCYDCPMERLCVAENRGEDSKYVRSTYYAQRSDTGSLRGLYDDDD